MADFNQFGSVQPSGSPDKADCTRCEALLADALDHTLSTGEQAVFDLHLATCADCTRMYMDARRGADWLVMLKTPQPEPSADLLQRILAATRPAAETQTALQASASVEPNTLFSGPMLVPAVAPAAYAGNVIPFRQRVASAFRIQTLRHTFMQPRLAMTAAMAFFSIALTLNLTGVHITSLRASDLKPSSLKRSFYDTNARVVRSIDNLRVVYEFESRVSDLRQRDTESTPAPDNSNKNSPSGDQKKDDQKAPDEQQKQPSPRPRSGSSRSNTPASKLQLAASVSTPHETVRPGSPQPAGQLVQVSLHSTPNVYRHQQGGQA